MKRKIFVSMIIALFTCATMFAAGTQEQSKNLSKVTVQIEGSAVPYYAPIFVAIEHGFFSEEGLEVDYMFGNAADITKNVAVGNVEFGFPNGEPVITARSQGIPVKVVHSTLQHSLGATIFLNNRGIDSPKDLRGKTVAITSLGSPNYVQLQALLKKNGMALDDIKIEVIGTEAIVPALVNGRVDAICFSMLRTFELKSQGVDVGEFRSDEFMPSFGNVVVVGENYLKENEQQVIAFKNALDKSMTYLSNKEHLKETIPTIIQKYTPTYAGKEDYMTGIIGTVYADYLWVGQDVEMNGFGYSNVDKWQSTIDKMYEYNLLETRIDASTLVWNN